MRANRGNDAEYERLESILDNKTKEFNSYDFARSEMYSYTEALKHGITQERREYLAYSNAKSLITHFMRTRKTLTDVDGYSEKQFIANYKEIISKSTLFKDLRKFAANSRYKKEIQEILEEASKIR